MGFLHCDLQPKNILIDEYGILKICDFKLTKKIPKAPLGSQPMASRGCPLYMAPELFSSEGVHSYSTDFWALGCILFELRMNGSPFSCKWFNDQLSPEDRSAGCYEETIDGTPQEILENMRKYELAVIVERLLEKYQKIERQRLLSLTPPSQRSTKSPNKLSHHHSDSSPSNSVNSVPNMSPEFLDLLSWILERAPPYRCSWYLLILLLLLAADRRVRDELTSHPFWDAKATAPPTPPETLHRQPTFEAMLR
jgi:serine/threonine protein kinase